MKYWRDLQRESFTDLDKLSTFLELDDKKREQLLPKSAFPLLLPKRLAEKMAKNSLEDPLFRQFIPLIDELTEKEGFTKNPVGDLEMTRCPKLIHKYSGRALIVASSACAMNCRYCFRRSFPYAKETKGFNQEIAYLQNDSSLHEIILSGGDPLTLSDSALEALFNQLNAIPHLRLIRFHTRLPIGIPERITPEFLSILENSTKQIIFVLHINHPHELDSDIFAALAPIRKLGIPILTQTVLLKGVNDSLPVLEELCLTLISHGILPYYLHQLDPIQGASHLEVPLSTGLALIEALRASLPGYAVPTYVAETPGALSKTPLLSN